MHDYDRLFEVQRKTRTDDGQGGFISVWETVATAWGMLKPLSAGKQWYADRMEARVTHEARIPFSASLVSVIAHDSRLVWGTRYFSIRSIVNSDELNEEFLLYIEEIGPA